MRQRLSMVVSMMYFFRAVGLDLSLHCIYWEVGFPLYASLLFNLPLFFCKIKINPSLDVLFLLQASSGINICSNQGCWCIWVRSSTVASFHLIFNSLSHFSRRYCFVWYAPQPRIFPRSSAIALSITFPFLV